MRISRLLQCYHGYGIFPHGCKQGERANKFVTKG
jgi:hypothetical protein